MTERSHPTWRAGAALGAVILVLLVGMALLAPWIAPDPGAQSDLVRTRFLAPLTTDLNGTFHLFGTDRLGRDIWARLAHGARISLGVGALAVLLSSGIGLMVGAVSAVYPRHVGSVLMGGTDLALALPRVVLLLLLAALWQPSAALVVVVLGVTGWMSVARLVHSETRAVLARPYVEGAIALGSPRRRVLRVHVIPNVLTPVITASVLGMANAISLEAGLSFLGVGVQPPTPSWGAMIASGRETMVNAPWVALLPGILLVTTVVALAMVADQLQPGDSRPAEPPGETNRGTAIR